MEMANHQPSVTTTPSWPSLPRQLTRSSTDPAGKLKNTPLNPITEKSLMVRHDDSPRQVEQEPTRNGQKDNARGHVRREIVQMPMPIIPRNPHLDSFGNTVLASKSFSYEKPNNISARSTPQPRELQVNKEAVLTPQHSISRPLVPRSSSLCGQNSGLAPNKPVPPLPLNISLPKRFRITRKVVETKSERTSGTVSFSEGSALSVGYNLGPISCMEMGQGRSLLHILTQLPDQKCSNVPPPNVDTGHRGFRAILNHPSSPIRIGFMLSLWYQTANPVLTIPQFFAEVEIAGYRYP